MYEYDWFTHVACYFRFKQEDKGLTEAEKNNTGVHIQEYSSEYYFPLYETIDQTTGKPLDGLIKQGLNNIKAKVKNLTEAQKDRLKEYIVKADKMQEDYKQLGGKNDQLKQFFMEDLPKIITLIEEIARQNEVMITPYGDRYKQYQYSQSDFWDPYGAYRDAQPDYRDQYDMPQSYEDPDKQNRNNSPEK